MIRAVILTFAIILFSLSSNAQTFGGTYKDWGFFTATEDGKKICYITSSPTKKTGTYKVRGQVYIIVTYRGKGSIPEVGVDTGYAYKQGSAPSFVVDGKKQFTFMTSSQTPQMSWTKDAQTDRTVLDALKRGGKVTVKGTSNRGTTSQDTYSLKGFSDAYSKMTSSCQ